MIQLQRDHNASYLRVYLRVRLLPHLVGLFSQPQIGLSTLGLIVQRYRQVCKYGPPRSLAIYTPWRCLFAFHGSYSRPNTWSLVCADACNVGLYRTRIEKALFVP